MKPLVVLLCLVLPFVARAADPKGDSQIPQGVVYAPADAATVEKASQRLREALGQGPAALAALFGLADSDAVVFAGVFFGMEINADNLQSKALLAQARYNVPLAGTAGLTGESFAAPKPPQKRYLAHYVFLTGDFSGKLEIREPTFDELALIWYWVGWDLDGPLLVVESATDKFVFDFDPKTGFITWVERLTRPCATMTQEGKELLSCSCARVQRDGRKWQVGFEKLEHCPEYSPPAKPVTARNLPAAYLRFTPRTLRLDMILAQQYSNEYSVTAIEDGLPGYHGPGKLLEGKYPETPKADGKPVMGYVLMGSVFGDDGRAHSNRILISTDDRLSAAALQAADTWRIEPATRDGKPVAEMVWQEMPFH